MFFKTTVTPRTVNITLSFMVLISIGFSNLAFSMEPEEKAEKMVVVEKSLIQVDGNGALVPLTWDRLSDAQRQFLAPVQESWNKLGVQQQHRLASLADRVRAMPAERQEKIQKNIVAWIKMTPEEKRLAKENFNKIKELNLHTRERAWNWYSSLPQEHRQYMQNQAKQIQTEPKGAEPALAEQPEKKRFVSPNNFGNAFKP